MEREAKRRITERLRAVGLRGLAMAYLDELRDRIHADGGSRKSANKSAYKDMWRQFEPTVAFLENMVGITGGESRGGFRGYDGDPDNIVDPNYTELDAGKRLRDAFTWVGDEFRRIVRDSSSGTTMMFEHAKTPPPTVLAIQIAEEYAQCAPGARRELFARLQQFATKAHDSRGRDDTADDTAFLQDMG